VRTSDPALYGHASKLLQALEHTLNKKQ
jgi:hypothetical protein